MVARSQGLYGPEQVLTAQLLGNADDALRSLAEDVVAARGAIARARERARDYRRRAELLEYLEDALRSTGQETTELATQRSTQEGRFTQLLGELDRIAHVQVAPADGGEADGSFGGPLMLPEGEKRRRVIGVVCGPPERQWTTPELIEITGYLPATVRAALGWACSHGFAARIAQGRYEATPAGREAVANS